MAALDPMFLMAAPLVGMTSLAAVFVRLFGRPTPPPPPTPYWSIRVTRPPRPSIATGPRAPPAAPPARRGRTAPGCLGGHCRAR